MGSLSDSPEVTGAYVQGWLMRVEVSRDSRVRLPSLLVSPLQEVSAEALLGSQSPTLPGWFFFFFL